jgi:hypothetical protein
MSVFFFHTRNIFDTKQEFISVTTFCQVQKGQMNVHNSGILCIHWWLYFCLFPLSDFFLFNTIFDIWPFNFWRVRYIFVCEKKSLEFNRKNIVTSESVYWRTDNTMAKRKRTTHQTSQSQAMQVWTHLRPWSPLHTSLDLLSALHYFVYKLMTLYSCLLPLSKKII